MKKTLKICPACNGSGMICSGLYYADNDEGYDYDWIKCQKCEGTGKITIEVEKA